MACPALPALPCHAEYNRARFMCGGLPDRCFACNKSLRNLMWKGESRGRGVKGVLQRLE